MPEGTLLESAASAGVDHPADVALGRTPSIISRLWQVAERKNLPLSASIEITLRCNLACVHCYNFDRGRPYTKEDVGRELTPEEIIRVIDELADAGCLFLSFTGGEALLHPQLETFVRHARKRRFHVKVKTNGATLSAAKVQMLADAGVRRIDVSLYGATPATHDAFTARAGSFDKTMRGIRTARQAEIQVRANMCVTRGNAGEIETMLETVEELGCTVGFDPFITARYDGTTSSLEHAVDHAGLEGLYEGPLRRFLRKPDFDPQRSVQCACARTNCGISATGEVYPCIGAPVPSGNLRQKSFAEIWKTSPQLNRIRQLGLEDFTTCKTCSLRPFCNRNSGVVYTNTGNYTGPEAFTCMDASVVKDVYSRPEAAGTAAN
jgi:radical SAM protein with 4Fe4S-binding SPASM domain